MTTRGLVTLERAALVGASDSATPDTAKLTVYVGRQDRVAGRPASPRGLRSAAPAMDSPAPQRFSGSTAPTTDSVDALASSAATSTCP